MFMQDTGGQVYMAFDRMLWPSCGKNRSYAGIYTCLCLIGQFLRYFRNFIVNFAGIVYLGEWLCGDWLVETYFCFTCID